MLVVTRFTTLWIYTILKQRSLTRALTLCFTTLWIYTILKHIFFLCFKFASFTTLWIYTILKLTRTAKSGIIVSLPYGFTLFSNHQRRKPCLVFVSLPYGFTLFSNLAKAYHWSHRFHYLMDLHYSQTIDPELATILRFTTLWIYTILKQEAYDRMRTAMFHYLMDLHYSQTKNARESLFTKFHYLMDLHYSQTGGYAARRLLWFHYLMDLHYSQTTDEQIQVIASFTTLWIYTILKRKCQRESNFQVSLPYGFTLFSNLTLFPLLGYFVSLPYGFTLFSNYFCIFNSAGKFHYLMDLHYSQTSNLLLIVGFTFHYLMDLHYSQTYGIYDCVLWQFHYLMDLHYSQTGFDI